MARIRSIHPGLFTDPEFATLSEAAQIFYLGLLTESDDNGVFEWNPAKLRIRLRPGKDGSTDKLLSELYDADKVRSYEIDGRKYGAVRNFRRFQRPKKPNSVYPLPSQFRTYVGLAGVSSEPVGNQFGTGGEIPPQMEDEGGDSYQEKNGYKEDLSSTETARPGTLVTLGNRRRA